MAIVLQLVFQLREAFENGLPLSSFFITTDIDDSSMKVVDSPCLRPSVPPNADRLGCRDVYQDYRPTVFGGGVGKGGDI